MNVIISPSSLRSTGYGTDAPASQARRSIAHSCIGHIWAFSSWPYRLLFPESSARRSRALTFQPDL